MAKLTAPLFGFTASGQLAEALVYSKWKGIQYARRYLVPANPNTSAQSTQRGYLTAAVSEWHTAGAAALEGNDKAAWARYAGVLGPMSGFNAFVREWVNERVAGGTPPGHFYNDDQNSTAAAAWGSDITGDGLTTENVTLHIGNTKSFFGVTDTQAAVAGVATFAGINTGFSAGERIYYYYDVGTPGTDYMRSGLYTAVLT